ncbi:hypothetical protein QUB63_03250 [Microcoleus sp. ARI1-B5]|uniref:hypothetical protein n=1 Tax=unclassified Microcoleus TaxID=2642155 RepID=UPI002FCF7E8A
MVFGVKGDRALILGDRSSEKRKGDRSFIFNYSSLEIRKGDRSFILGNRSRSCWRCRSCWKKLEWRSLLWEKIRSAIALVAKN